MLIHANGETDPDRPADLPEPWSLIDFTQYNVAMGGEHSDDCDPENCECGDLGFSTSSCQGCGSGLHGDRYRFTLFSN
jgi:hypothetical protein